MRVEVLELKRIVSPNRIGRMAQHKASDGTSASPEVKCRARRVQSSAAPADATIGSMASSRGARGVRIVEPGEAPSLGYEMELPGDMPVRALLKF